MVLGDAVTKLWRLYISLTMFQESSLDPCSTLEHQTWSNDQSQHDLLYGGVSLSISLNLKQAPVPYATPKWPIGSSYVVTVGQKVVTGIFLGATNPQQFSNRAVLIGLIHDTRYLCTPLRTDRKKQSHEVSQVETSAKQWPMEEIAIESAYSIQKEMKIFSS